MANFVTKLTEIKSIQELVRQAINNNPKKLEITTEDSFQSWPNTINEIFKKDESSNLGFKVRFIDYDGTILKTEYVESGPATAPTIPEHQLLTFQSWNTDFSNITHDLDVGATYISKSGNTEIQIFTDIDSITISLPITISSRKFNN